MNARRSDAARSNAAILGVLATADTPLTSGQAAERLGCGRGLALRALRRLVEDGDAECVVTPGDPDRYQVTGASLPSAPPTLTAQILRVLADAYEPMTARQISGQLGAHHEVVRERLGSLRTLRRAICVGGDLWVGA